MQKMNITFSTMEDIQRFEKAANSMEGNIDIRHGNFIVDGKSLLGLVAMGIKKNLEAWFYNANDFENYQKKIGSN